MIERWVPVPRWPRYQVSDQGGVRRLAVVEQDGHRVEPRMVKQSLNSTNGYLYVTARVGGRNVQRSVHSLVLEGFVGPRPSGHHACHGNGVRLDNRLCNLRWDTVSANAHDTIRHGRHAKASLMACGRGHAFAGANVRKAPGNGRRCRSCQNAHNHLRRQGRAGDEGALQELADDIYRQIIAGSYGRVAA